MYNAVFFYQNKFPLKNQGIVVLVQMFYLLKFEPKFLKIYGGVAKKYNKIWLVLIYFAVI